MAIGQGIAVTPLQMLRAICAIANGGTLVKPYIVQKIVAPDGTVLKEGKTEAVRKVITPEVAEEMRTMMEKVVSEGGGKTAQIKTAQIKPAQIKAVEIRGVDQSDADALVA